MLFRLICITDMMGFWINGLNDRFRCRRRRRSLCDDHCERHAYGCCMRAQCMR